MLQRCALYFDYDDTIPVWKLPEIQNLRKLTRMEHVQCDDRKKLVLDTHWNEFIALMSIWRIDLYYCETRNNNKKTVYTFFLKFNHIIFILTKPKKTTFVNREFIQFWNTV